MIISGEKETHSPNPMLCFISRLFGVFNVTKLGHALIEQHVADADIAVDPATFMQRT